MPRAQGLLAVITHLPDSFNPYTIISRVLVVSTDAVMKIKCYGNRQEARTKDQPRSIVCPGVGQILSRCSLYWSHINDVKEERLQSKHNGGYNTAFIIVTLPIGVLYVRHIYRSQA